MTKRRDKNVGNRKIKIAPMFATFAVMPDELPWPKAQLDLVAEPKHFSWTYFVTASTDPGPLSYRETADFIQRALSEPKFRHLIELACAHVIAADALRDRYWRRDRFHTRIDEQVMPVWEMAQEIFEANAGVATPDAEVRHRNPSAKTLELWGRKWASGQDRPDGSLA
jgi:hypothetical protein